MRTTIRTFRQLIEWSGGRVTVACDTEFQGPHTLTAQFAARLGDDIVVQLYSSPAVPDQPAPDALRPLLPPGIETPDRKVVIRDARPIPVNLSPAQVLTDLFGLGGVEPMDRVFGDGADDLGPPLTLTLVGHFWTADFFRVFGREFFASLVEHQIAGGQLVIPGHRHLSFKEGRGHRFRDPVLGYAYQTDCLYPIRVNHFDTCLTFGKGSLDDHARTFVGVGKLDFGEADKADMLGAFRRDPSRAYAYAVTDAVLTLLVRERMKEINDDMYRALDLGGDIPPLRPTQGSRVAEMTVRAVARVAAGSVALSRAGKQSAAGGAGRVSLAKVRALLREGSGESVAGGGLSEFGEQTGQTHGGLLFSRSPTRLFHEAPGMFRDVDLKGCYAGVMGAMSLYAGRPVVHEPGSGRMTLRDAVAFLGEHAAGPDAWVVKVSGPIAAGPNALIPSTRDALTNGNYKRRAAKRRAARGRHQPGRYGFAFDRADAAREDAGHTAIYTGVVEAGVVAWPTWLMIQALPPGWRDEYERLEVDTILFYPRVMVAEGGPAFDGLVGRHRRDDTPWAASIDMAALRRVIERRIDDDHVTLRFDLAGLVEALRLLRERAVVEHGRGSAAEKGYKEQVNTLYGAMACPNLPTNNVVAANYITPPPGPWRSRCN